ncbi:MAG: DNA repair protein RadA, partial [Bacteroidales bacterium]|nr:DNA repair protein RadA [Bacteroidales bacterium]
MAKKKTVFFCQNCGAESARWIGRCPACGEWNTYVEEIVSTKKEPGYSSLSKISPKAEKLKNVDIQLTARIITPDNEFNRVLGGGIVPGSLVLIGGEPGIGKSTLALQIALRLTMVKTLYVSGEESARQIRLRAERLGKPAESETLILTETNLETILNIIHVENPGLIIVDSIQTLHSESIESTPGSVSQVRETAAGLLRLAKETNIPVILIGHITKDGTLAGPKILEHIVDTVLNFEGDQHYMY